MNRKTTLPVRVGLLLYLLLLGMPVLAQINWPSGQLLPTFPATAQTQDLIYQNVTITGTSWRWEAEGASLGHITGHLETDGWVCQVSVDAANQHMIFGPYAQNVPAGNNIAEFRMMIDNNTANNDAIVDIDVYNATTGTTLASRTITRQQFPVAGSYTTITLPFLMPTNNQSIELRVYWKGAAYTKVDWVSVTQDHTAAERYLFASLKGIVNRTQPRIFSYEGDAFSEGQYTWMQSLGLSWTEYSNSWDLITKYRSEIAGLIVYDPAQIHTVNLATALVKDRKALIASPALLSRLTAAPYNLPILLDLRGQFTSKLQVYQTLYNTYWPGIDHRVLVGINPEIIFGNVREYAAALGLATIWLDPGVPGESELLNSFLSSMPAGSNYMGWWPEEGNGVTRASSYGVATIASDASTNLTVHSGMPRAVNVKPIPPKPTLQNKIYVAFILSDGDNIGYVEHLMRKLWNNPDRGKVPIGWTLSPAMLDAMPGALNFFHQTATNNDNLISGPSGYGYVFPNAWSNASTFNQYVTKSEQYNRRAGFRIVTIWNSASADITQSIGDSYATYAPTLLGTTTQNTAGTPKIYQSTLINFPLTCNYCSNAYHMLNGIRTNSSWDRVSPKFLIIQAQPWQDVKPSDFKSVMDSLNSDYIVVRPDHLFQLMREANGLPIDPGGCTIVPNMKINSGAWQNITTASLTAGGTVVIGPGPGDGTWSWTGPNGFTSSAREITISNIQTNTAGNYIATHTATNGCVNTQVFTIVVCTPPVISPNIQVNGGAWQNVTCANVDVGNTVTIGPGPGDGTWSWTGPNGFAAYSREITFNNIQSSQTGAYTATYTNYGGCSNTLTFNIGVINPALQINGGSWQAMSSASLSTGSGITFGPGPGNGTWSWTGPGGFTSNKRETSIANIQPGQAGTYVATYTNPGGCTHAVNFSLSVANGCAPTTITPHLQVNGGAWQNMTTASVNVGANVVLGPGPTGTWKWTGPNGYAASTREITLNNFQANQAGGYLGIHTNSNGCVSTVLFDISTTQSAHKATDAMGKEQNSKSWFKLICFIMGRQLYANLNAPASGPGMLQLIDMQGVIRYHEHMNFSKGMNYKQLDISSAPSGIYLLRVQSGNKVEVQKIVIAR
jgi:hypothetical protein